MYNHSLRKGAKEEFSFEVKTPQSSNRPYFEILFLSYLSFFIWSSQK